MEMQRWRLLGTVLIILLCWHAVLPVAANGQPEVFVVNVKGEIDDGQVSLVHRALAAAERQQARAIILELDTFGGLMDSAVKIRDMIMEAPLPTICYVKNRAWSAGALIALAHEHIAIAPGGSIGAAEPIPATEKTIAAVKAEFAATANKRNRDTRVAEAMVDKTLGFSGYAAPGQILALTDYQALEVGYAELVAPDRQAVLTHYGLKDLPVVEFIPEWSDRLAGFLSQPAVKSLLLSIIFVALMTEIKTAGMGVAAAIGVLAALLFFGSQWLTGLAGWWEVLLFLAGIALVLMELITPGFGFFGIAGALSILGSLFMALGGDLTALNILAISLIIALVGFLILIRFLPQSRFWQKLILKEATTTASGYIGVNDYQHFLGKQGRTVTMLRPAGIIDIDGQQLDVVADGRYIKAGTLVEVVSVSGNRIVVRAVNNQTKE